MLSLLGTDWSVLSPAEHLFYFTEETLARMLQQVGFCSVEFVWRLARQTIWETMNPLNTHRPSRLRSRLVRHSVRLFGRWVQPFVVQHKRTDRLIALAVK